MENKYKDHNYTLLSVLKEKDKYIEILEKERAWSKVAREALSDVQSHHENISQLVPGSVNPNIKRIVDFALKRREEIFNEQD